MPTIISELMLRTAVLQMRTGQSYLPSRRASQCMCRTARETKRCVTSFGGRVLHSTSPSVESPPVRSSADLVNAIFMSRSQEQFAGDRARHFGQDVDGGSGQVRQHSLRQSLESVRNHERPELDGRKLSSDGRSGKSRLQLGLRFQSQRRLPTSNRFLI